MLTRRGKATIACAVVLIVAGRVLGITELFGLAAAAAALAIAAAVRVRVPLIHARISVRVTPDVIVATSPAVLELFVENTGISPTAPSRLQLVPSGGGRHRVLVPRLNPGERATVTIGIDTGRRGRKGVPGYDAVVVDALGLATHRVTSSGPISWVVRPRIEDLQQTLPLTAGAAGIESTRSAAERLRSGASLLRIYNEGDDLRLIHWPTTARVGDLMVREGGDPDFSSRSGTTILVATRTANVDAFERAVEVAASLASAAEREGNFRLATTDGADSGMDAGLGHLEQVTLALATVQAVAPHSGWSGQRTTNASLLSPEGVGFFGDGDVGAGPPPGSASETDSGRAVGLAGGELGPFEVLGHRVVGPDESSILFVVAVASASGEPGEIGPDHVAALPPRAGPVILVVVGGSDSRFERIGRQQMAVFVPVEQSLRALWGMVSDLPVGEVKAVPV